MSDNITDKYLWVEKYRPKELDDVILPENYSDIFKKYIEEENIPHLLFYGGPGSGKTTIARILINKICKNKLDLLMLNGSSSNSIDVIRSIIEDFVSTSPTNGKIKIVYFDEADYITHNAQAALRNVIEMFHSNARFIFTCNFISKINEAIQSRCQLFEFKKLPKEYVISHITKILKNENIKYDENSILKIINLYYPDIRRIIGTLQSRVKNNEIIFDQQEVNNEVLIISHLKDMSLNFRKFEIVKQSIHKIQVIVSNHDLDFREIYQRMFEDPEVPIWMKIVINEFANKHDQCMLPAMNFMGCIYECVKHGNELASLLQV